MRLDSGEVLVVSIAAGTVRVSHLRRRFLIYSGHAVYETRTDDAYIPYFRSTSVADRPFPDGPDKPTGSFLRWFVNTILTMPSLDVVLASLPSITGRNLRTTP